MNLGFRNMIIFLATAGICNSMEVLLDFVMPKYKTPLCTSAD